MPALYYFIKYFINTEITKLGWCGRGCSTNMNVRWCKCLQLNVLRSQQWWWGKFYEGVKQEGRWLALVFGCLSISLSPINNICTFWSIEPWRRRKVAGHDFHCGQERGERGERELDQLLLSAVSSQQPASHQCWDLEPKSHQFYVHKDIQVLTTKQCWILEKQFHFFH